MKVQSRKLFLLLGIVSLLLLGLAAVSGQPGYARPAADKGGGGPYAASPQDVNITGAPLTVVVRDSGSYGVYRNEAQQFYGGYAEGVYLWVNGVVWGPERVPAGRTPNQYTPISNTLSGSGSQGDPWVVTTVLNVGTTGLRLTQKVSYVNGQEFIRTEWSLCSDSARQRAAINEIHLFHAADLYTGGNDAGYGFYDAASGSIGGYTQARDLYQIFIPITQANNYEENGYSTIWSKIGDTSGTGGGFNNTYLPTDYIDNGAGLEWIFDLTGNCTTISDYLSFSNIPVIPTVPGGSITPTATPTATPTNTPVASRRLPANVWVSLQQDPDTSLPPGGVFTLTLRVRNIGLGTAYSTGVRIPLDSNLEVIDFKSNSGAIYVDYMGTDAVSVVFHDMERDSSNMAYIIARVRTTTSAGTKMTSRAQAYWDDNQIHVTKWSNSVTLNAGPAGDLGFHGLRQILAVNGAGPVAAGTLIPMSSTIFGQEEKVSYWLNGPNNTVSEIANIGIAMMDGSLGFSLDTTGLAPGSYTLVAHGLYTDVEGVGAFTIR